MLSSTAEHFHYCDEYIKAVDVVIRLPLRARLRARPNQEPGSQRGDAGEGMVHLSNSQETIPENAGSCPHFQRENGMKT